MLFLPFVFGLAVATIPSDDYQAMLQRGNCPMFWFKFNDRCYKYVATRVSWADAELHCVSEGANLVSIHSMEEQNFIKGLIKNFDHAEETTWIGLTDIHKENSFMWSNGQAVNFVYWYQNEPNNLEGTEHCVHTNHGEEKKWNDEDCYFTLPSVCAFQINCLQPVD
ncbi:lactose-binding lectin l-2-like [Antennarius striatus]|uniref:lactose-binding lectin l-2-like n=1 Tax=Antennarius striatus TaxID=241820 RepID=UPI0035ADED2A